MARSRTRSGIGALLALGVALLVVAGAVVSSAGAETFGQIGSAWGSPGSAAGQFFNPGTFGVDPVDGSVYAGDLTADENHYRIQKLSASGAPQASAEIPAYLELPAKTKPVALHGVAVDHAEGKLYLVEGCYVSLGSGVCKGNGQSHVDARRILIYDIAPSGSSLVAAGSLTLPEGEKELYFPRALAVDPSSHELVMLAEDAGEHTVVQRIDLAGEKLGARFVDTENKLRPGTGGEEAKSLAVGPDGTTYTLTGGPSFAATGAENTRAWELPPNLSKVEKVPGFESAAESEGWTQHLLNQSGANFGGPQMAISPDGSTLYWKENLLTSTDTTAGEVLVRGFSLTKDATTALYGGGEPGVSGERCAITTSAAAIATTGSKLVVFDFGPEVETLGETPPYGDRVLTFGPGGGGCPAPLAKFSVAGQEAEGVTVGEGEPVDFDASASDLHGEERRELIWKFGDGSPAMTVKCKLDESSSCIEEAAATVSHKYTSAGEFTASLEIKLEAPVFGDPPLVERTLKVVEGAPPPNTFKLTIAKGGTGSGTVISSPGINCGGDCEQEYASGTLVSLSALPVSGSSFAGWSGGGCAGTGVCKVTLSAATTVTATFNVIAAKVPAQTTPSPSPAPGPAPPGPSKSKLTPKQKALAKCKKLKGKAHSRCVKAANSTGKHKGKSKHRNGHR